MHFISAAISTRLGLAAAIAGGIALGATHGPAPAAACGPDDAKAAACAAADTDAAAPRVIQIGICLDTSGSMNGLIEAAKQKLWAIVNDLALAEPTPELQVALLTFGNDGHAQDAGWVAVQTPFTTDLDLVSERLFELSTNGGTELVGRVLDHASRLDWHPSAETVKIVIVAGNESADQDQEVPYATSCRRLITRGILVNAIYCGPEADDIAEGWRDVARRADGRFASIDQDQGTIVVETPFDEQLNELSASLNTTYVPFGPDGERGWANQVAQDQNALNLNKAAAAARCSTKGSALYSCGWDLVDARKQEGFTLATVADEQLPEALRGMSLAEREQYLDEKETERDAIRTRIAEVTAQREAFVRQELKRLALDESMAFDNVVRRAVRDQAAAKGFTFADATPAAAPAEGGADEAAG